MVKIHSLFGDANKSSFPYYFTPVTFSLSHNKGIQVYMRQLLIRFQEKLSIVSMSCKAVNKSVKKKLRLQTSVNAPFQTGFLLLPLYDVKESRYP